MLNPKVGMVLQVEQTLSGTGFVYVLGEDKSTPHPATMYLYWNYIVREYDPANPTKLGQEYRLTYDNLMSAVIRNFPHNEFQSSDGLADIF